MKGARERLEALLATEEGPHTGFCPPATQQVLRAAVRQVPAAGGVIVEIGPWRGKSTAALAVECFGTTRRIFSVDPYVDYPTEGPPVANGMASQTVFGIGPGGFKEAQLAFLHMFEGVRSVTLLHCTSEEAAHKWPSGKSIHLLFIDGDHREVALYQDLELWVPLVAPGGTVICHDWDYLSVQGAVMRFLSENEGVLTIKRTDEAAASCVLRKVKERG